MAACQTRTERLADIMRRCEARDIRLGALGEAMALELSYFVDKLLVLKSLVRGSSQPEGAVL